MKQALKQAAVGGVKWTSLSSLLGVVLQFVQIAILARLLSTDDFGLMGIAGVVVSFSVVFLDMGMSSTIIQRNDITENEMSSLFWFNVFSGVFLFVLTFLAAPFLAGFFENSRLTLVIRWVSISFLITPFEKQFIALLQKKMAFKRIAQRNILSQLVGMLVGILSAFNGMGVYALVALQLATALTATLFMVVSGIGSYQPHLHFRAGDLKRFQRFGAYITGDGIVNFFNRQVDTLLIGKLSGMGVLGIYNLAKNFSMRPYQVVNPIVTQVTFPLLAQCKDERPLLLEVYSKTINYLSSVNFPVYIFMAVFSEEIVLVFFGQKWWEAFPVLRMLALAFMIRSIFNPMGALFVAKGKPQLSFYWNLALLLLIPAVIFFSARFGIFYVAVAQFVLMAVLLLPAWKWLLYPLLKCTLSEYLLNIWKPFKACCAAVIIPLFLKGMLLTSGIPAVDLAAGGLLFFPVYLYVSARVNPGLIQLAAEQPLMKKMMGFFTKPKSNK